MSVGAVNVPLLFSLVVVFVVVVVVVVVIVVVGSVGGEKLF